MFVKIIKKHPKVSDDKPSEREQIDGLIEVDEESRERTCHLSGTLLKSSVSKLNGCAPLERDSRRVTTAKTCRLRKPCTKWPAARCKKLKNCKNLERSSSLKKKEDGISKMINES